jgi:single-strand DNA-binding protein
MLLGRIAELKKDKEGNAFIKLAVQRAYKNKEGIYETDFLKIQLPKNLANNYIEYMQKGDLVAFKGHIETRNKSIILIAEKITFLKSTNN